MMQNSKNENDRKGFRLIVSLVAIAVVMILVLGFGYKYIADYSALSDSSIPELENSINPDFMKFNDGTLKGIEGTLEVGKPLKINRTIAKSGTSSLNLKITKGYYNIRTNYDNGALSWVLYDGDTVLARQDSEDNPGACFDIQFKKTKRYSLALSYDGNQRCKYTINFETSVGPYWPEKHILDLNKEYPTMNYPHGFFNEHPKKGDFIIGDWGKGGAFSKLKCTFHFSESEFGEIRKNHILKLKRITFIDPNYTKQARITRCREPYTNMWNVTLPMKKEYQPESGGFCPVIVELEDEDNHIYFHQWTFYWQPSLPKATFCTGEYDANSSLIAVNFQLDRRLEGMERRVINEPNVISVQFAGQKFTLKNANVGFGTSANLRVPLPVPILKDKINNIDNYPLSIDLVSTPELQEEITLPPKPISLIAPNFWTNNADFLNNP